jgi:hypothetical protein
VGSDPHTPPILEGFPDIRKSSTNVINAVLGTWYSNSASKLNKRPQRLPIGLMTLQLVLLSLLASLQDFTELLGEHFDFGLLYVTKIVNSTGVLEYR